ncbi:6-phosphofructokinase [Neobacillus jeddahensis]|uniref:6-phosphofructokinase n=1 Tax=Neobacillus jeddahensis TaxID=1461580 RepID=UPI00058B97F2|nr:6-phosphofructokinase [Neobacillus jeddahensis]
MKKIGVVKVGTIPQAVSVVIDRLVYCLQKQVNTIVTGIQTKGFHNSPVEEIVFKDLEQGTSLCSITYSNLLEYHAYIAENHDILFVFCNEKEIGDYDFLSGNFTCRILLIPINLFNEQDLNLYPLGFDSALNEVVNSIYKVKDTAGSLVFANKRLFLIKIPGETAGVFLKTAATALECDYIEVGSKAEIQQITRNLIDKYQEGSNYALLLLNEAINEDVMKEQLSVDLQVDFRSVMIEEAQCIGGNPSVRDRVQALELAEKMVQWSESGHSFETVLIEKNDQIKLAVLNEGGL